jgi:hypothetical protein
VPVHYVDILSLRCYVFFFLLLQMELKHCCQGSTMELLIHEQLLLSISPGRAQFLYFQIAWLHGEYYYNVEKEQVIKQISISKRKMDLESYEAKFFHQKRPIGIHTM